MLKDWNSIHTKVMNIHHNAPSGVLTEATEQLRVIRKTGSLKIFRWKVQMKLDNRSN